MKKSILITGGTGSFGKKFISTLLEKEPNKYERIVIYSRDELKQWELQQKFPTNKYNQLRYFLGDIRDKSRFRIALQGITDVIHAAALKQVPAAEYNPFEFIKTNVIGSNNIIEACLEESVERVVALSTDKAAAPVNLYGATKLCADKLFVAANNISGSKNIRMSVVRYGNVAGSRGSVIPLFTKQAKEGHLTITDPNMTRFSITLQQGVDLVRNTLETGKGYEIIVPKIPSYRVGDVAKAIAPSIKANICGIRPGEKMHEEMITSSDSHYTYEKQDHFLILPNDKKAIDRVIGKEGEIKKFKAGSNYASNTNDNFLSIGEIKELVNNINLENTN